MKKSRIVYIYISVVYILVVVGATVYGLTVYQDNLPQVELIPSVGARVPKDCLQVGATGMVVNTVERQDGPWGYRYVIKQLNAYSCQELPDGDMFVFEVMSNENPLVTGSTVEYLYDGMEVRIS
ncbi:MAG: hypothetical protein HDT16_12910 [Oscillibacter sp.]|nr:hypothetical protein [Oscillibacter sp.]